MEEEVIAWRVDEIRRWVDRREERVMKGVKKKKTREKVWDKVKKKSKQDVMKKEVRKRRRWASGVRVTFVTEI